MCLGAAWCSRKVELIHRCNNKTSLAYSFSDVVECLSSSFTAMKTGFKHDWHYALWFYKIHLKMWITYISKVKIYIYIYIFFYINCTVFEYWCFTQKNICLTSMK
jgi:hypothetical protein